jgi:hypothetical protein
LLDVGYLPVGHLNRVRVPRTSYRARHTFRHEMEVSIYGIDRSVIQAFRAARRLRYAASREPARSHRCSPPYFSRTLTGILGIAKSALPPATSKVTIPAPGNSRFTQFNTFTTAPVRRLDNAVRRRVVLNRRLVAPGRAPSAAARERASAGPPCGARSRPPPPRCAKSGTRGARSRVLRACCASVCELCAAQPLPAQYASAGGQLPEA